MTVVMALMARTTVHLEAVLAVIVWNGAGRRGKEDLTAMFLQAARGGAEDLLRY